MITLLVISWIVVVVLSFTALRLKYDVSSLKEVLRDKDTKITSLVSYIEAMTAKKVKKTK